MDREFGTGVLKISPGHDHNDYHIARKLGLPILNVMNKDGTLNDAAGIYRQVLIVPEKVLNPCYHVLISPDSFAFLCCGWWWKSHNFYSGLQNYFRFKGCSSIQRVKNIMNKDTT